CAEGVAGPTPIPAHLPLGARLLLIRGGPRPSGCPEGCSRGRRLSWLTDASAAAYSCKPRGCAEQTAPATVRHRRGGRSALRSDIGLHRTRRYAQIEPRCRSSNSTPPTVPPPTSRRQSPHS